MIIRPKIFEGHPVAAGMSTRLIDDELFYRELGDGKAFQTISSKQVHEDKILIAKEPGYFHGYDAIIGNKRNIFLSIYTADCVPAIIYAPDKSIVAVIHAGWRGTTKKILEKTVEQMKKEFDVRCSSLLVYIGACIGKDAFEVEEDVASQFNKTVKRYDERRNKFLIDLKSENLNQLISCGVDLRNIEISNYCTVTNNNLFYSYRKENGKTGRLISTICLLDK